MPSKNCPIYYLFSQSFASQFVKGDGFDFTGYLAARQASVASGAASTIKSAVTFVIDWIASLWKSASDAQVAEEWTNPSEAMTGQAESVINPLVSLAVGVAEGTVPETAVTGLGTILSTLSDKLDQLDALNAALPDDQGTSPEIEALEQELETLTKAADSALADIAESDRAVLSAFSTGEDFIRTAQMVQDSELASAGAAGNPNDNGVRTTGNSEGAAASSGENTGVITPEMEARLAAQLENSGIESGGNNGASDGTVETGGAGSTVETGGTGGIIETGGAGSTSGSEVEV